MSKDTNEPSASYTGDGSASFEDVARLFDGARELEGAARVRFLDEEAGTDTALRREVERLLGLHEADSGLLDKSVDPALAVDALEETAPEAAGIVPETIGNYKVERPLGRGGMGQVYLALRKGGDFEKRVAIKVLRPGMDDADLLRRFKSERRILAHLEHPGIATLIDGGAMEDGRPYVVMEHVEGTDLIRFVREHELSLEERLRLFIKICAAVEYAHANLVVHRDLKPSNILVTADGEPKLLDFGIAKLQTSEGTDHSIAQTMTGMGLFTPEYASPEQVRGELITTSTDVYSLGALLYELLTEVRAQPLETRRPAEVDRVVCEAIPRAPSSTETATMTTRWRRRLGGDLDNITLMALRKEPQRRYASVAKLSEDIQRFLGNQTVHARKDTFGYRTSKFVRRNAWWVGVAALVFVMLSSFASMMVVHAARMEEQRDIATLESTIAGEVSAFLVTLFDESDPYQSGGDKILARTLLDRGAQRVQSDLTASPLVQAKLMEVMGRAYSALGLFEEAQPLLSRAFELRADDVPERRAETKGFLGAVERLRGRYEEGERLMQESLDELAALGVETDLTAVIQTELAMLLAELGRAPEALLLVEQAQAIRTRIFTAPHSAIATAISARAKVHQDLGEYERAEVLYFEALAMQEGLSGAEHPLCAVIHTDIADLFKHLNRLDEGLEHLRKALAIDLVALDEGHPQIDNDYFAQAQLLEKMGDFAGAEELFRKILVRDRANFGEAHPYVALDISSIATVVSSQGRFEEAVVLFEEALAMQKVVLPEDSPEVATTLSNLGVLYRRWSKPDRATTYFEEALAIREKTFPPDHPALLTSRNMIAVTMSDAGRVAEAEVIHHQLLAARRKKLGVHPQVGGSLYSIGMCRQRQDDLEGALEYHRESVEVYEATLPPDHVDLARALVQLGAVQVLRGLPEEGLEYLTRGVTIREAKLPADHTDLADARRHLGNALARLPVPGDFEPLFESALSVLETRLGEEHKKTQRALSDFVDAYEAAGMPVKAEALRARLLPQ